MDTRQQPQAAQLSNTDLAPLQEIASLRAELSTSQQRVDELEEALAAATAAAAAAVEPDAAQQEEQQLQQQQQQQELQRLVDEVEEHRNAAAVLHAQLEAARTQHAQHAAELEGQQQRIGELEMALAAAAASAAAAPASMEPAGDEVAQQVRV